MNKLKPSLKEIRKDLSSLRKYWVVIYGSYCTEYFNKRSDIDIAVITMKKDPGENKEVFLRVQQYRKEPYDIRVFELLPLNIKASLMENYKVLFGPKLEISEYFYHYRSLWKDVERRYERNRFKSIGEKLRKLEV